MWSKFNSFVSKCLCFTDEKHDWNNGPKWKNRKKQTSSAHIIASSYPFSFKPKFYKLMRRFWFNRQPVNLDHWAFEWRHDHSATGIVVLVVKYEPSFRSVHTSTLNNVHEMSHNMCRNDKGANYAMRSTISASSEFRSTSDWLLASDWFSLIKVFCVLFNLIGTTASHHLNLLHVVCQGLALSPVFPGVSAHIRVFPTCVLPVSVGVAPGSRSCPSGCTATPHQALHKPVVNNPSSLYQILYALYYTIHRRLNSTVYSIYLYFFRSHLAASSLDSGSPRMPSSVISTTCQDQPSSLVNQPTQLQHPAMWMSASWCVCSWVQYKNCCTVI